MKYDVCVERLGEVLVIDYFSLLLIEHADGIVDLRQLLDGRELFRDLGVIQMSAILALRAVLTLELRFTAHILIEIALERLLRWCTQQIAGEGAGAISIFNVQHGISLVLVDFALMRWRQLLLGTDVLIFKLGQFFSNIFSDKLIVGRHDC